MKKSMRLKAFSLVECIVAIAILGVTSLLICQAYSQLMYITRMNNNTTHSLADQMQDAETRDDSNVDPISLTPVNVDATAHSVSGGETLVMYRLKSGSGGAVEAQEYYTCVNVYAIYPYVDGVKQVSDTDEPGTDIRYIYFHQ